MARVVAIVDWRRGGLLKDNVGFLERAAVAGRALPRGWRAGAARWRSLTVFTDGTCRLGPETARTAAARLERLMTVRKA